MGKKETADFIEMIASDPVVVEGYGPQPTRASRDAAHRKILELLKLCWVGVKMSDVVSTISPTDNGLTEYLADARVPFEIRLALAASSRNLDQKIIDQLIGDPAKNMEMVGKLIESGRITEFGAIQPLIDRIIGKMNRSKVYPTPVSYFLETLIMSSIPLTPECIRDMYFSKYSSSFGVGSSLAASSRELPEDVMRDLLDDNKMGINSSLAVSGRDMPQYVYDELKSRSRTDPGLRKALDENPALSRHNDAPARVLARS